MSRVKMGAVVIALALGFTTGGWAQGMRGGMGRQTPRLLGEFKPVVGAGAQYQMTAKNGTMSFAYVIVGQEDVEGSTGYWMEIRSENPDAWGNGDEATRGHGRRQAPDQADDHADRPAVRQWKCLWA